MRHFVVVIGSLAMCAASFAEPPRTYSRATQPEREALDRLNLKIEWAVNLPVAGTRDGLATVQVVDPTQMFVQTRAGTLVAIDAVTGRQQWSFRYPFDHPAVFPVAVNSKFVFAIHVAKLYILNRLTGSVEMEFNLPAAPSTGPTVDFERVYICYTAKQVQAFKLPDSLRREAAPKEVIQAESERNKLVEPKKKPSAKSAPPLRPETEEFDRIPIPKGYLESSEGEGARPQRPNATPSLGVSGSVLPPYNLRGLVKVESLQILPSIRQPYTLKPEHMNFNQRTPSIGALSASVARLQELSNLQPPKLEMQDEKKWVHGVSGRISDPPVLVGYPQSLFLWVPSDSKQISVVLSPKGQGESIRVAIDAELSASPAAAMTPPAATGVYNALAFLPLTDGEVLALDLYSAATSRLRIAWRANVGGLLNHQPLVAKDGVYAFGDSSGVVRIDSKTGDIVWRTEPDADHLLATNDEYIYVIDSRGRLQVYGKDQAVDPKTKRGRPIGTMDIVGFNVPITNYVTDRIFVGADNGLIVCGRNTAPKYARPAMMTLPTHVRNEAGKPPMPVIDPAEPKKEPAEPKKEQK